MGANPITSHFLRIVQADRRVCILGPQRVSLVIAKLSYRVHVMELGGLDQDDLLLSSCSVGRR